MTEGALNENQKTKRRKEQKVQQCHGFSTFRKRVWLWRDTPSGREGPDRAVKEGRKSHGEQRVQDWKKEKEESGRLSLPQRCHL